jgi:hypothetical protein
VERKGLTLLQGGDSIPSVMTRMSGPIFCFGRIDDEELSLVRPTQEKGFAMKFAQIRRTYIRREPYEAESSETIGQRRPSGKSSVSEVAQAFLDKTRDEAES